MCDLHKKLSGKAKQTVIRDNSSLLPQTDYIIFIIFICSFQVLSPELYTCLLRFTGRLKQVEDGRKSNSETAAALVQEQNRSAFVTVAV